MRKFTVAAVKAQSGTTATRPDSLWKCIMTRNFRVVAGFSQARATCFPRASSNIFSLRVRRVYKCISLDDKCFGNLAYSRKLSTR